MFPEDESSGNIVLFLPACAEKTADEATDDCGTEGNPAVTAAAMTMTVVFGCMMVSRRSTVFFNMMPGGGFGGTASAATAARGCESRSAERHAGKSENRKFFESLVHSAPSLSVFVFDADLIAAYKRVGAFFVFI